MQFEEILEKWFEQAKEKLGGAKTQVELNVDKLCCGVIQLLETYANSVLILLKVDKRLPAKALLRVMSDLSIKTMWCLDGLGISSEEFGERFEKWRAASLWELKRKTESELAILKEEYGDETNELEKKLGEHLEILEREKVVKTKLSPWNLRGVWKEQGDLNFVALYSHFNEAVHPDWVLLQTLQQKEGSKILYRGDKEENLERLRKFCLVIVGYLFERIYSIRGWDFKDFEKDIKKLRGNSAEGEEEGDAK